MAREISGQSGADKQIPADESRTSAPLLIASDTVLFDNVEHGLDHVLDVTICQAWVKR